MSKITIYHADKFFTWNGTLIGKNQYYGYYNGAPFVSDGVMLNNGAVVVAKRNKHGNWHDKFECSPLAHALDRRYREDYNARENMKEAIAKAGPYHSMAYVPQKKHNTVIA